MLWKQRKRIWCGLPWTFTVYSFDEDCIYIDSGVFTKKQEEIRLYRVLDISVTRTFGQRIFGMGTITLKTSDKTTPEVFLINLKKVMEVKTQLSNLIEESRDKKRISGREFMSVDDSNSEFVDTDIEE